MIERGDQRAVRCLGDHGDPACGLLQRIVVVNDEVIGLERVVDAQRIAGVRGHRRSREPERRQHHVTRAETIDSPPRPEAGCHRAATVPRRGA